MRYIMLLLTNIRCKNKPYLKNKRRQEEWKKNRALSKDDTGKYLLWKTGCSKSQHSKPSLVRNINICC